MMSPPYSMIRRRTLTPGSETTMMSSPTKRSRLTGESKFFAPPLEVSVHSENF
jgi:hypothetical protein